MNIVKFSRFIAQMILFPQVLPFLRGQDDRPQPEAARSVTIALASEISYGEVALPRLVARSKRCRADHLHPGVVAVADELSETARTTRATRPSLTSGEEAELLESQIGDGHHH